MSETPNNWHSRFDELAGALLGGELSEQQAETLRGLLASQPGARRRFAEHMQLAAFLEVETTLSAVTSRRTRTRNGTSAKRRWRAAIAAVLSLAAAIALVVLVNGPIGESPDAEVAGRLENPAQTELVDAVAVITRVVGAEWATMENLDVGSHITPGFLALEKGLVQFEFLRGAIVVAEGPAALEFVTPEKVVCREGKLRVRVPELSQGFTVLSPQINVVDFGTEFAVDVPPDGRASVHVFEGKVEVFRAGSDRSAEARHEIGANHAVAVSADGEFDSVAVDASLFVSASDLQELASAADENRQRSWEEFRDGLQRDPRVVVYYDFEQDALSDRILQSHQRDDRSLDGAIVGCTWSSGRWPGKAALEFKRPGDRVRIHIPGEFTSMTYAAWVRLDGLDRAHSAFVLPDGVEANEPHWQILRTPVYDGGRRSARLILGLRYKDGSSKNHMTEPLLGLFDLGRWSHFVTVHDGTAREVVHYIDGQLSCREPLISTASGLLRLGNATIGNWLHPDGTKDTIRNLNGRMDELIIFNEALDASEIQRIYRAGTD